MECTVSTDKNKLDLQAIHNYISNVSYWGRGRSMNEVLTSIENSLCFGLYDKEGKQIGFARVVTDFVVFAYLMDVIVFDPYRGVGYGRNLIHEILHHKEMSAIKTFALKTKDAHNFYEDYGFQVLGGSEMWMVKEHID